MAVPPFYYFLRPALEATAGQDDLHWSEVAAFTVKRLNLSADELTEMIPGGRKSRVDDRVSWALTYLRAARLLEKTGRGRTRMTERGRNFLANAPDPVRTTDLDQFPEFVEFYQGSRSGKREQNNIPMASASINETPLETLQRAHEDLRSSLAQDILDRLKQVAPDRFERLIVDLMLRLGYGGTLEDAGMALGRSGDEGVDGVIKQDRLGLDNIYLQAKRWDNTTVGRKEIQAFVGALSGKGASKGVFITSSSFSKEALDYARNLQTPRLSLINGFELARLMIDHDLGVTLEQRFDVKRIDSDYFAEE